MIYYALALTEEEKKQFVVVMKRKLKRRGMTQQDLAKELGVSCSSIYSLRSRKISNRFIAAAIANYLDISENEWKSGNQDWLGKE